MIHGHPTSISLEEPFWQALRALAARQGRSLANLVAEVDQGRRGGLSSALRVHVLLSLQGDLAAAARPRAAAPTDHAADPPGAADHVPPPSAGPAGAPAPDPTP